MLPASGTMARLFLRLLATGALMASGLGALSAPVFAYHVDEIGLGFA